VVESGKRAKRPKLDAALAACKKNKAKLIVAKLDRLPFLFEAGRVASTDNPRRVIRHGDPVEIVS
jgi:DNA invertase Pin-like site-specific DNA recombinase